MRKTYTHLGWDSDFFGFKVARILPIALTESELSHTLDRLKQENYRMVYWQLPADAAGSCQLAHASGGFLADEKVTYTKELSGTPDNPHAVGYAAVPYTDQSPDAGLIALTLQSAVCSRFRLDPRFPAELCDKLFTSWITRSVDGEIAQQVLVVRDHDEILGMITLGSKNGRGDIGLIAVVMHARGQAVGKTLVTAAERYFLEDGYIHAQVVTQRRNLGACRLYESCGFEIEEVSHFFHFWL